MATTQINDYGTSTAMLDGSLSYGQGVGNEATQKLLNDELKKAGLSKKYRDMMQFIGSKDYKAMNIVDRMTIIVEMIVNDLDKNIEKLVQQLYDKSQQLKNVTKSRAENNPGLISGMGTETGILQAILTMKVQERQRILEFLTNFARTVHETEKRAIDRIELMGAIKSQELTGLKLVSLTEVSTNGDKAKAIADLNAVKTNPTVNLDNTQAGNILAVLGDADTKIPDGDEFSSVRAMATEWNADDATPEQKATAENNLINYVNTDKEQNIPTVLTALGELASEAATPEAAKPKDLELSPEQQEKVKVALSRLGTVVGSTWDGFVRGFQPAAEVQNPKTVTAPATGTTITKADGKALTQSDITNGTAIDTNVKKVGDDLFIQTQNNQAIRVSKDGVLSGIKTNAKSEFVTVDEKETRALKDGDSVDIALTTETRTFDDGDGFSFDKEIPTKILRVQKQGENLLYGVFELKGNDYVLTDGKHTDVKPSAQFRNDQPLKYLHATDGNIYNEDGKTKWVGPNPSTVGAADAPPQYSSLASVLNSLNDIEAQKARAKLGKTAKERQEEDTLMAAVQMMGGQGGQASGGIGGGLGMQFGADSFGNFNVGVGVQGTNFGAGFQFGGGPNNGFGGGFGFPGFGNGGVVNLEEMLTVVFAILEQQERKRIVGYLKDMYAKSSKMSAITGDQVKDKPAILNSMNIETSISQAFLQNSMGKRQNMLETLYGIIRNTHESKRRSIQNLA